MDARCILTLDPEPVGEARVVFPASTEKDPVETARYAARVLEMDFERIFKARGMEAQEVEVVIRYAKPGKDNADDDEARIPLGALRVHGSKERRETPGWMRGGPLPCGYEPDMGPVIPGPSVGFWPPRPLRASVDIDVDNPEGAAAAIREHMPEIADKIADALRRGDQPT